MATTRPTQGNADSNLGQFSLREVLTIAFKRKVLVAAVALSIPMVVLIASLLLPRTYEVSATLVVNRARAEMPLAPTDSDRLVVSQLNEQDLNSEIEVLRSREMIEAVLESMGDFESSRPERAGFKKHIGAIKQMLGSTDLSVFDALVVDLQENIGITAVRRSNAIRIGYQSTSPEWATNVVKTLTEEYLERRTDRFQSPQVVSFFEEQMVEAENRLLASEEGLERYLEGSSITMVGGSDDNDSLAAQKELVMARLSTLESLLGEATVAHEAKLQEVSRLRKQLSEEPERLESSNRMNQNAATEEIERALTALLLERDALLQEFKPDSRHVTDIDRQIALAEERLRQAEANLNVDGTEPNPVYLQLKGDLLRAETELESTFARIAPLTRQIASCRLELNQLNEVGFGLDGLRRQVQAAEEDYLLYRKKHEEARASAAMDKEKFVNVTIAQPARMPLRPVPRGLLKRLVGALAVGVLGGFGLAFSLEQVVFRSFTTGDELTRKLGIPHIASIPEGSHAR